MKTIYTFGNGQAEGGADMRDLLGGKGANLAEMNRIGVPVPPGFTITTDVCRLYNKQGREAVVKLIKDDVLRAVAHIEGLTGNKFNDPSNPQLVSVRSGAPVSMPGMMDTVLNLGINDAVAETLAERSGNPRFAWDSYRRFVQMYGDVVLGMKPKNKTDIDPFEAIIEDVKEKRGVKLDTELTVDDLKELVVRFKAAVKESTGKDFPTDAYEQLWGAIYAVFDSWNNDRAILYRRMNQIPEEYGTAVNVQAMVYGNMGNTSATGVCFSRDAATGENIFNGEYLINAQGEDVVAGVRTPQQIMTEGSRRWAERAGISEAERAAKYPSFKIFNYAVNGEYWNGGAMVDAYGSGTPYENGTSCISLLSYGKFDYYTAGDAGGNTNMANPVAKVIGRSIEAMKADHHMSVNCLTPTQMGILKPKVIVTQSFARRTDQPMLSTIEALLNGTYYDSGVSLYFTGVDDVITTPNKNLYDHCHVNGHVVIRVAPGGDRFWVYQLDDTNNFYKVKSIEGPIDCD